MNYTISYERDEKQKLESGAMELWMKTMMGILGDNVVRKRKCVRLTVD